MKKSWIKGLSISLGCLAATASGQEPERAAFETLPPAIVRSSAGVPLVSLGKPQAVTLGASVGARPSAADESIAPVSFQSAANEGGAEVSPKEKTLWASKAPSPNHELVPTGFASDAFPVAPPMNIVAPYAPGAVHGGDVMMPPCCEPCGGFGFYVGAEYLLWGIKDSKFPPLVTTSPPESFGILGLPGTVVLFGGGSQDNDIRSGGRFTVGFGLPKFGQTAIETSFLFLNERTVRFGADSNQFPVLARPFFNLNEGIEFSQITASPGVANGRIDVASSSRLWGGEINLRRHLWNGPAWTVDWLIGFRYLELNEGLDIREDVDVLVGEFAGSQSTVFDSFSTRNRFYGGQLGLVGRWGAGRWNVDLWTKLAMGNTNQLLDVVGNQVVVSPTGTVSNFTGGLLALDSNIGRHTRNEFSLVPEVGINVGYNIGCHWRLSVGYNLLFWSNVLRPGDQIDRVLDVTRIPNFATGSAPAPQVRPVVPFTDADFWAQGATFGVEWRW